MFYTGFLGDIMQIGLATRDPWDVREDQVGSTEPIEISLGSIRPNPFASHAEIEFAVGSSSDPVSLRIFDASGRLVKTLVSNNISAGTHRVTWRGDDDLGRPLTSGVYFCELGCGSRTQTSRLLLLRTGN
jgi:hypothetical protein